MENKRKNSGTPTDFKKVGTKLDDVKDERTRQLLKEAKRTSILQKGQKSIPTNRKSKNRINRYRLSTIEGSMVRYGKR